MALLSPHEQLAHARQVEILRGLTPRQRLEQARRMAASMRTLLAAGFRLRHPQWSEEQIRQAVAARILHARTG